MIPHYPVFAKLHINHQQQVADLAMQFDPYSDFNFTSLFCWNIDGATEVSILNQNLIIRMPDYIDGRIIYSMLGTHRLDDSINVLLNISGILNLVPEAVVQGIQTPSNYKITEDEDNFDYVYDLHQLSVLPGGAYKKKRNKANVFITDHEHLELAIKLVDSIDDKHADMLKMVDHQWAVETSRDKEYIQSERKALATLLDNFEKFDAVITEVWVDGEIKAFSINEKLTNQYAICHFEKALKIHHEHLNTFLAIEVSKQLREVGCQLVNWEQDLGLKGLRKSKQSYHPSKMLKKYTISANS